MLIGRRRGGFRNYGQQVSALRGAQPPGVVCSAGTSWDPWTNRCECPEGTTWNGSVCEEKGLWEKITDAFKPAEPIHEPTAAEHVAAGGPTPGSVVTTTTFTPVKKPWYKSPLKLALIATGAFVGYKLYTAK